MAVRLDGREISAEIRKATNTSITDNVRLLDTKAGPRHMGHGFVWS